MAAFEGSQKSQLQGVSQQIARERLEGQVSAQENMLSDVVTGLRRRPGAQYAQYFQGVSTTRDQVIGIDSDVGGVRVKLVLNLNTGAVFVFDANWTSLATLQNNYLIASNRTAIRTTVVGNDLYILNRNSVPAVSGSTGGQNPTYTGFFFVKTGAFEKTYTVSIAWNGGHVADLSYTTPAATVTGAANQSSPEYIANQLAMQFDAIAGPGGRLVVGSYVYLIRQDITALTITSNLPSSYIGVSNQSWVQTTGDLPAQLPAGANGMIMAVGSTNQPTYFKLNTSRMTWIEDGAYNSPATLVGMPVRLSLSGSTWSLSNGFYEGRFSGDDTSNPNPAFIGRGITGMGAFQGRLVLMAGSTVCMSGAANAGRWYRSTITNLVAADPIFVSASANSSAAYEHAVPFQKDLLLFSQKYQALVPGGNVAITPQSATVIVTSTYEADMTGAPVALGRTLMYPAPRSADFYGMLEMLPSEYTDSQYLSSDVTGHLPKYLPGRCRFGVSSSVANIAVFASTTDYRQLVVHEYQWDGDQKVQQAWHRWTFPYDIADAFFTGSEINLLFVNNGQVIAATLDPRVGTLTAQNDRRPYLDLWLPSTVTNNSVAVPGSPTTGFRSFDPNMYLSLRISDRSVELLGEEVGIDDNGRFADHLVTVPSFESGDVSLGLPYRSSFSPTVPMVKDQNGVVISSNKLTLLRYMIGTANSYEYEAIVSDTSTDEDDATQDMATVYWGSADLVLGEARVNSESIAILTCRTAAATTTVMLYTDSLSEMNIVSMEYVCRYNQKLRRR